MKYLRYKGEFVSIGGHIWRAEIWQDADAPFFEVGDLTFDADCPIQIEWGEKAKHEVICGSTATLQIVSPGDRTYEDLYTIEPGSVRCDIYRDDALYWSGCIDTEFYEEPYEQANNYTVTLTFSDFGILNRLKWDKSGLVSLADVVRNCIEKSQIKLIFMDESMISTEMRMKDVLVRADNFYDEDGEAMALDEVLDGVLQPLGLKIVQKCGTVYVYDLNGLYVCKTTEKIEWNGDSQTMSTDNVYNNARVTWSTYAQEGNLMPDKCWGMIKTDADMVSLNTLDGTTTTDGKATYYSFSLSPDITEWNDTSQSGFTIWTSDNGMNAEIGKGPKFFKIVPQRDAAECEGVMVSMKSYRCTINNSGSFTMDYSWHGYSPFALHTNTLSSMLFKSGGVWLPPVYRPTDLMLRIRMEMLFDPRYNPYEEGAKIGTGKLVTDDQQALCNQHDAYANFIYVPVVILWKPDGSDKAYAWDNRSYVKQDIKNPIVRFHSAFGNWKEYSETDGKPNVWGWLAYYDVKDRAEKCGVLGWKNNRQAINPHTEKVQRLLEECKEGQYIDYPGNTRTTQGTGGTLSVAVYGGAWRMNDGGEEWTDEDSNPKKLWDKNSWVLCKLPEIEILNMAQYNMKINTDDVVYSARLNEHAKESIDIDTICGSAEGGIPTARGAYFSAENGFPIERMRRAGRMENIEDLLIGTLYSQYATRHTKLNGEADILCTGIMPYTEQNQEGKKFICVSDVQDVRMDTSDATFIELSPDEYKNQNEQ